MSSPQTEPPKLRSETLESWASLDPEDRQRLKDLAGQALGLPPEQRSAWIAEASLELNLHHILKRLIANEGDSEDLVTENFLLKLFNQPAALPGDIFDEWEIVKDIGKGGMGEVFLARRVTEHFDQTAALKLMRQHSQSSRAIARFRAETRYLARVGQLIDAGQTSENRPFLVTKYAGRGNLAVYCDQHKLSLRRRLEYFAELCELVEHVHREQLVHCDIKPSNVLIGDDEQVYLVDFGIARFVGERDGPQNDSRQPGTRRYCAPEQNRPGTEITRATDIYSLGRLLELIVIGDRARIENEPEKPWQPLRDRVSNEDTSVAALRRCTPRQLRALFSGEIDEILCTAMALRQEDRYATAKQLGDQVERFRKSLPDPDLEINGLLRRLWIRSGKTASLGVALVLIATFAAGFWFGSR